MSDCPRKPLGGNDLIGESSQLDDLRAVLRLLEFARLKIEAIDSNVSSAELDPVIKAVCAELGIEHADEIISTEDLAADVIGIPVGTA